MKPLRVLFIALLLACAKSVVDLNTRMHAGHWDKADALRQEIEDRGFEIRDSSQGVIIVRK
jgi:phosphoglycerate dehydrogenase-like enzyme